MPSVVWSRKGACLRALGCAFGRACAGLLGLFSDSGAVVAPVFVWWVPDVAPAFVAFEMPLHWGLACVYKVPLSAGLLLLRVAAAVDCCACCCCCCRSWSTPSCLLSSAWPGILGAAAAEVQLLLLRWVDANLHPAAVHWLVAAVCSCSAYGCGACLLLRRGVSVLRVVRRVWGVACVCSSCRFGPVACVLVLRTVPFSTCAASSSCSRVVAAAAIASAALAWPAAAATATPSHCCSLFPEEQPFLHRSQNRSNCAQRRRTCSPRPFGRPFGRWV